MTSEFTYDLQVNADPVPSVDDGHDELDFEAEEPDKVEQLEKLVCVLLNISQSRFRLMLGSMRVI